MPRVLPLAVVLVTAIAGCLSYEGKVTTVHLDDKGGHVRVDETYHGIHSDASETDTSRARADFSELIHDWWRRDKTARLWIEGDRLYGMSQSVWGTDDYFGVHPGRWTVDSTGFTYHRTDTLVATDGDPIGQGRWHWPPETRTMVVREQPFGQGTHWHSEFASWYRVYVAQHGLDEGGMSPGPLAGEGGRMVVSPSVGLGLPLGPTASLSTVISLAKNGFDYRRRGVLSEPSISGGAVFLDAAVGTGGGRLSIGRGHVDIGGLFNIFEGVDGYGLSLLRTWGRPFNARAEETYVGPSCFKLFGDERETSARCDLGVLYRVDGRNKSGRLMPYVSLGVGRFFIF